jgi:signal recognition particle subunit SEC65
MPDYFLIYPAYLHRASSRTSGRRVPAASAPPEASVAQIVAAAQTLGYQAVPEADKHYPRQFYSYAGRVKITKKAGVTKTRFLKELAHELKTHPPQPLKGGERGH